MLNYFLFDKTTQLCSNLFNTSAITSALVEGRMDNMPQVYDDSIASESDSEDAEELALVLCANKRNWLVLNV